MQKVGRPRELPNYDFSGIYMLLNTVNNSFYIGQAQNILKRFNEHRRNRNGNIHYKNSPLYNATKKYGWNSFEISVLEKIDNIDLLNEREIFWINSLTPEYNIKEGGNCARGWNHSEESKLKMSKSKAESYIGENNPFFGKNHSEETRNKWSEIRKGRKLSKEHSAKIAASFIPSNFYKKVKKIDIKTLETIAIYKSLKDACIENNIGQSSLSQNLTGRSKSCGGFKWEYVTESPRQ